MKIYKLLLVLFISSCNKHLYLVDKEKLFSDLKCNEFYILKYQYEYPLMLQSNRTPWSSALDLIFVSLIQPFFYHSYFFTNCIDTIIYYNKNEPFYLDITKVDKMIIKTQSKKYHLSYTEIRALFIYGDTLCAIKNLRIKYRVSQNKNIIIPLKEIHYIKIKSKIK